MPLWTEILILLLGTSTLFVGLMCRYSWAASPLREDELEQQIEAALTEAGDRPPRRFAAEAPRLQPARALGMSDGQG